MMSTDPPASVFVNIAEEIAIPAEGTLSQVVYRDDLIRVVVFAFDEGQELTEHTAAKPAIVQVVSGRIRLDLDGDPVELGPGSWVRMAARLPHAVHALEPTVMLLTLLSAQAAA
jgi:quercetin dioxygenase-like cupin family protein